MTSSARRTRPVPRRHGGRDPRPLPGAGAASQWPARRLLRRPRRHPGASRRQRCGHRVSAASQRQYPLAIPEQPRDRRDPGRRSRSARRPARRQSRRGGLRRQHDDADLPSRTWTRARLGPGRRDRRHGARPPCKHRALARAGARARRDRPGRCRSCRRRASSTGRRSSGRCPVAPGSSPSAPPPTRSARSPTWSRAASWRATPVRSPSWTPFTTRRTGWWMCARSAATSWPAPPTSSTARTSACCTVGANGSARWTFPSWSRRRRRRPSGWRPGRSTTRDRRRGRRGRVPCVASHSERQSARAAARGVSRSWTAAGWRLVQRLLDGLGRHSPACGSSDRPPRPRGHPRSRSPWATRHPDAVADALAEEAVFVSTGDFYATSVVRRYGLASRGGLVRAGCAAYTTADEVDRLLAGVARLARAR